jgi:hypothetical protein
MWQAIEVSVGPVKHRGRFRVQGRQLLLEWRGGRSSAWCGILKPEIVAAQHLRRLVSMAPVAA